MDGLTRPQRIQKRMFDLGLAILGLALTWWLILVAWILASIDTRANGFFRQTRIGQWGRPFQVVKIRTMKNGSISGGSITKHGDPRVTHLGAFWRRTKIDELPQLWNVLKGDMTFVGPRPDVPGYADKLQGADQIVLSLRPGITGPASIKYQDEERILATQSDPKLYNDKVIYPDKVRINRDYIKSWCLSKDVQYIWRTIVGSPRG